MIKYNNKMFVLFINLIVIMLIPIVSNADQMEENDNRLSLEYKSEVAIYEKENDNSSVWLDDKTLYYNMNSLGAISPNQTRFNLAEQINIRVKNQGNTKECWAFCIMSSMESNLLYKNNLNVDFSERHMDYATSSSFNDASESDLLYNRSVGYGGIPQIGLAYLTNGQGAVYEEQMPFEENTNNISINDINIQPSYYVSEYRTFPKIVKKYDANGIPKYYDSVEDNAKQYTTEEVAAIRYQIKDYLVNYGALAGVTASAYLNGYSNTANPLESSSYCCKDIDTKRDHAITIVGWDDNYSRNNFSETDRPSADGAYIVLQSYGTNLFNNGYMYISYEDALIETELFGVNGSKKYDYDNLYQNDYYGPTVTLSLNKFSTGYFGTKFTRDSSKNELLTQVSFNIAQKANCEVWINPNGSELSENSLIKVSDSKLYHPGYHTVSIDPVRLKSDTYVVVIKQMSDGNGFNFNVEAPNDNKFFTKAESTGDNSFISVDGKQWHTLISLDANPTDIEKHNILANSDICIKAYTLNTTPEENPEDNPTENPEDKPEDKPEIKPEDGVEISSEIYKISSNYIQNIATPTTTNEFLQFAKINSNRVEFLENNNIIDKNSNSILKTGMKLCLDSGEYILVLRGDISGDGKISLLDISKLVAHYAEYAEFELKDAALKAADMNVDGRISIIDISQLIKKYSEL